MLNAWLAVIGAFALFLFEPFLGKALTPRFGGGAQVWIICLLFFQAVVLIGYTYGHLLGKLPFKRQIMVHAGLIALALGQALVRGGMLWVPAPSESSAFPTLALLSDLTRGPGLILILLSATSPLVHRWHVSIEGRSPYHLYAWSNLGSLLGLLGFPLLLEPWLPQSAQAWLLWSLVILVLGVTATVAWKGGTAERTTPLVSVGKGRTAYWILCGALGNAALVSATSKLSNEVGSIPLLWILPLVFYLLSFILVFDARWAVASGPWRLGWGLAGALGAILLSGMSGAGINHPVRIVLGACLFTGGLGVVCHGRLYELRPDGRQATEFLLATALGGVLGGLAMALGAPLVLNRLIEVGLVAGLAAMLVLLEFRSEGTFRPLVGVVALGLLLSAGRVISLEASQPGVFLRNFYGIIRLQKVGPFLTMKNLQTLHGLVDRRAPDEPLLYYTSSSGLGRSVAALRSRKPNLRVGVIGLGVGSAATYARPGDAFEFMELNPIVGALACRDPRAAFPYLQRCKGDVALRIGDARILLDSDRTHGRSGQFDLLLVDAFSGDSVPWHLLTREALDLYLWHLAPDGILLFHVSNPLPVDQVVFRAARARGLYASLIVDQPPADPANPLARVFSQYVLIERSPRILGDPTIWSATVAGLTQDGVLGGEPYAGALKASLKTGAWRDDRASLTDLLVGKPLIKYASSPRPAAAVGR